MRLFILLFCILTILSCKESPKSVVAASKKVEKLAKATVNIDSLVASMFSSFNEPKIVKGETEVFRFLWKVPWPDQPIFVFRVQELPADEYSLENKYTLVTKICGYSFEDSGTVLYKGNEVRYYKSIVLDSIKQEISSKDWNTFRHLINSSYYWAFENPCPNGTGYLDASTMALQSVSRCCSDRALKYHFNIVSAPSGGFSDTYRFLMEKSDMNYEKYLRW